jgi:hypothetical protein
MTAVNDDALHYVVNQVKEMQERRIVLQQIDDDAMKYVMDQRKEMCKIAIQQNDDAMKFFALIFCSNWCSWFIWFFFIIDI